MLIDGLNPVFSGTARNCMWTVLAGFEAPGVLVTAIRRSLGGRTATSGFKGPAHEPFREVRVWFGDSDGLPGFVVIRAEPQIAEIIGVDHQGNEVVFDMSPTIPSLEIRFAVAAYPSGMPFDRLMVKGAHSASAIALRSQAFPADGRSAGWNRLEPDRLE